MWDPEHKIDLESIHVEQDLIVECRSVHILEMLECVLRRMIIKYVRALWTNSLNVKRLRSMRMGKEYPVNSSTLMRFMQLYVVYHSIGFNYRSSRI